MWTRRGSLPRGEDQRRTPEAAHLRANGAAHRGGVCGRGNARHPRMMTEVALGKSERRARAPAQSPGRSHPKDREAGNVAPTRRGRDPAGRWALGAYLRPAGLGASGWLRCAAPRRASCAGLRRAARPASGGSAAPARSAPPGSAPPGGALGARWRPTRRAGWARGGRGSGPPRGRWEAPYLGSDVRGSRRGRTTHFFPFSTQSFLLPSPGTPLSARGEHSPATSCSGIPRQPGSWSSPARRVAAEAGALRLGNPRLRRPLGGSVRLPPL